MEDYVICERYFNCGSNCINYHACKPHKPANNCNVDRVCPQYYDRILPATVKCITLAEMSSKLGPNSTEQVMINMWIKGLSNDK